MKRETINARRGKRIERVGGGLRKKEEREADRKGMEEGRQNDGEEEGEVAGGRGRSIGDVRG